jgi:hypothetical protein
MSSHVFGDGGFCDLDTQFEQLTVDARSTPQRIVATHPADQITNLLRQHRTPGLATPHFPRPIQTKALAMPSDDGLWLHDKQG